MAKEWFEQLIEQFSEEELDLWKRENQITAELATHYPAIYKKRFSADPGLGYDFLNREMNGREPSFGYSVFAQILAETPHNVVITTNFDNLIEVSLYTFTGVQPLVCGHESLARFARASLNRPVIAKIHRDLLLEPKNSTEEIETLATEWNQPLLELCRDRIVIAIGYGGNDGSLMNFLFEMEKPRNLLWCILKNDQPSGHVTRLLEKHDGKLVEIDGFDELMFDILAALGLKLLDVSMEENAKRRAAAYREQVKRIQEKGLKSIDPERKEAAKELSQKTENWWNYELRARAAADHSEKQKIYEEGLKKFPASAELIGNYANLFMQTGDYDKAEAYYKKSLALDPSIAEINGNYAVFLKDVRRKYDDAEKYFKKALELFPNDAVNNSNYAILLSEILKRYNEAEKHYKKALELDSNSVNNSNYANFLWAVRKNYEDAEKHYKKALALDPDNELNNGNYAGLLLAQGRKEEATPYLNKAFDKCRYESYMLELWFYRYAHYPEYREAALQKLNKLIEGGVRSPGWSFDDNISRAEKEGHPDIARLKKIASVITEN